jgi:NAD(P)H-nitrite reductase large subunit
MEHIVIIGNGIAGTTTARNIRKKSDARITIISGETDYFFSRTALMYIYMGHMKFEHTKPYEDWFWEKNKLELKKGWVKAIDFDSRKIALEVGETIQYDKLVIATGSISNKFNWPGQDLNGVQGLYSLQDLELMEANTKNTSHAVVVGGGLIGVEMVEMLHSRGIHVTFLVREKNFWDIVLPVEDGQLIERHIRKHGIDLRLGAELNEIIGNETGHASAVITTKGERIPCTFVGLTVGVSPNVDFLRSSSLKIEKGILVNDFLETNITDVYAVGDCAQIENPGQGRRAIEPVWYTGRIMGETLAQTLTGNRTVYNPGVWFNSAKFFDIEYQTYGIVSPQVAENEGDFYWEHPDGDKALHFRWTTTTGAIRGINAFGIRLRHEVFDRWISEGKTIDFVVDLLEQANFDPEFYRKYEQEIKEGYRLGSLKASSAT